MEEIKQRLQQIEASIDVTRDNFQQLKTAIVGDPLYGRKGFIDDINEVKSRQSLNESLWRNTNNRIDKIEKRNFKQVAIVGAIGAVGGALSTLAGKIGLIKLISFFK